MTTAREGDSAPDFRLKDKDGVEYSLAGGQEDYTIVFFYPKDDTPGCTVESKEFSDSLERFRSAGIRVFGISGGDEKTKTKFCKKHALEVTLLSDPEFQTAQAYGVYGEKKFMGRTFLGINRRTFVISKDRRILKVYESVKPEGHAEEVFKFVSEVLVK